MAKASDNEFPSVLFTDGTADPSSPSVDTVRLYFKSDAPYWINSGGTATQIATGATSDYVHADGGGKEGLNTVGTAGTALTIDLADGNVHDVTFDENCTLTFSGTTASVACSFTLIARQDGTGGNAVTWPAAVDWAAGSAIALGTAANNVDVFTFLTVDDGTTWLGFQAGAAMA